MNPYLDKANKIQCQINWLKDQLTRGEHLGAGLSIGISLGPMDHDPDLEFECSWHTEEILQVLIKSLEGSLHQHKQLVLSKLNNEQAMLIEALEYMGVEVPK